MPMDVERNINMLFQTENIALKSITTLTIVLTELLKLHEHERNEKRLLESLQNGGKLSFTVCDRVYADELKRNLDYEGIAYHESTTVSLNGKKMIVFSNADAKAVENIISRIRLEHNKGGIVPHSMLKNGATSKVVKFGDLSEIDARLISEMAKKQGVNISILDSGFRGHAIAYELKDRVIMDNIKRSLAIQKSYPVMYQALAKQMSFEEEKAVRLATEASKYTKNIPYYLVGTDGTSVKVTSDKVFVNEPGSKEGFVIDTDDEGRSADIENFVMSMESPQKFTAEEYQKLTELSEKERMELFAEKDKDSGRPELTAEEYLEIRKAVDSRILYEQKLSMDNPEQEVYTYGFENNEMRMATFQEFEHINSEFVHDRSEQFTTLDPVIYDDLRNGAKVYKDTEDISFEDYENEISEMEVLSADELDHLRDQELGKIYNEPEIDTDVMNDMNNNYIPDEFETP